MAKFHLFNWAYDGEDEIENWSGSGVHIFSSKEKTLEVIQKQSNKFDDVFIIDLPSTLETLRKLYGLDLPTWPPKQYATMMGAVKDPKNLCRVPWSLVMPRKRYYEELLKFAHQFEEALKEHTTEYYREVYLRIRHGCLDHMMPSSIDETLLAEFKKNAPPSQLEILENFTPGYHYGGEKKLALSPIYSTVETRTGRLKVVDGPNILHLKKEYRAMIKSIFGDEGKIWYLDYASLEPRILLSLNTTTTSLIGSVPQRSASNLPLDIYEKTLSDLGLEGKVPRNVAKTAILSALYGQSEENTIKQLSDFVEQPGDFVKSINDYFGISALKQKLSEDLLKRNGKYITNYYGRPVVCDDTKPYALLNYYVQSTAVDVALLGFFAILQRLVKYELLDFVRPIYLLHDALILDVHNEVEHIIPKLENLGSTGIMKFKHVNFFLRAEEMIK